MRLLKKLAYIFRVSMAMAEVAEASLIFHDEGYEAVQVALMLSGPDSTVTLIRPLCRVNTTPTPEVPNALGTDLVN